MNSRVWAQCLSIVLLVFVFSGCSIFFWRSEGSMSVEPESFSMVLGEAKAYVVSVNESKDMVRECTLGVYDEGGLLIEPNQVLQYSTTPMNLTLRGENVTQHGFVVVFDIQQKQQQTGEYVFLNVLNCSIYNKKGTEVKDVVVYQKNVSITLLVS